MRRFRTILTSLVLTLGLIAFTSTAMADGEDRVPEIDPGSIGSALTLLGFGATMLLGSRRRK